MSDNESIKNACEVIDAAMLSGDSFVDEQLRCELRSYIERWERVMKEIEREEYKCPYCGIKGGH